MKPQAVFVGEITRNTPLVTKTGKPFLSLKLEGAAMIWGEKTWRARVEAVTYRDPDSFPDYTVGRWVVVSGDTEAKTNEWQGRTYANLVITGTITLLPVAAEENQTQPPRATAGAPTRPAQPAGVRNAKAAAATPMTETNDDDVPF